MKSGIVAFAFGAPCHILSNNQISIIATKKARELNAPIYTQFDICITDPKIQISYARQKLGSTPSTYEIAKGAIQWAKKNEITELWIVAASPHLSRCFNDLMYATIKERVEIEFKICEEVKSFKNWFCKKSIQKHTQSPLKWWPRELILLSIPIPIYIRITNRFSQK